MKLAINEPCHEDWNNMKIGLISRHCDSCDKSVMDFTKMTRAEIITYILSNPNESVCGRMTRDQFDFRHEDIPILVKTLERKSIVQPFLILALVSLSLSAVAQDTGNIQTPPPVHSNIMGKVRAVPNNDTHTAIQKKEPIKGNIQCEKPDEEIEVMMGEVVEITPVELGMVVLEEPPEPPVTFDTAIEQEERVYQFAEVMPQFPGGMEAFNKYIQKSLKYPKYEEKNGIQGNVYVRFVVTKSGSIERAEILRSVEGSINFDREVLRLISEMPTWEPGEQAGKKVNVYMTVPFRFVL